MPLEFSCIDLNFLGIEKAIATAVVRSSSYVALVDPGPSTCLDSLERGLRSLGLTTGDVTDILLTHVHIDHAGATGTIVRRHPHVRVFVHSRGARHMADPTKLIDSASRFFGAEKMDQFWGEIAPVPTERMVILEGGERIRAAGRDLDVAYTPGHASHHVTFFDSSLGVAFAGDALGLRVNNGYVLLPTPPPDVDVEHWSGSVERIAAFRPDTMFVTHFGPVSDVGSHLETFRGHLSRLPDLVRQSLATNTSDEERSQTYGRMLRDEILRAGGAPVLKAYEPTAPLEALWFGLARYWRTREVGSVQEPTKR